MSHFCIKYENKKKNKFEFLYEKLKNQNETICKANLINYLYSNNTNSINSILECNKKFPITNINVFNYYKERLKNFTKIETEDLFYNKLIDNINFHSKNNKKAILLSGGTDSILIACIVSEIFGNNNVICLTLDDGTNFHTEEVRRAEIAAKNLNLKHYIIKGRVSSDQYLKIIKKQANSIDRSSVHYDQIAKKIIEHYGDYKVDVLNGEFNFLETSVQDSSDPTRHLRDYLFRNKNKLRFLKYFELFDQSKLHFNFMHRSNNKYLMTLNDIIRFIFEKKTDIEYMTGWYNGKSKFPGYHGIELNNNINFKKKFFDFFKKINFRNIDTLEEFLYSVGPIMNAGTTNIETVTNIMQSNGLNMIFPFSSDELYAITNLTKFYKNKILQKDLISRKYKIDKKVTYFVKNHSHFNKYFADQFDKNSFKKIFQKSFFDKLKQNIELDDLSQKEIIKMENNGITNQRQFRIYIISQVFNIYNVK